MPDFEFREVLACPRIDEVPIPSTPSFNCECEQCGRAFGSRTAVRWSPSACVWLAVQRTTIKSDKQSRTEQ